MTGPALAVDPALLVAVPLVGSALPVLAGRARPRLAWATAVAVALVHAGVAAVVCATAVAEGVVETTVAGLPDAYGISLVVDGLSVPFVALAAVATLGVLAAGGRRRSRAGSFHALVLLLLAGVTGVAVTADAFNLYVFLEISGLSSYALVAHRDGGAAAFAALKYLLVGTVGASLYLLGVAYAYAATGTLAMGALADAFATAPGGVGGALPATAFALAFVGLATKMALFPLHVWKPTAYAEAPTTVAAILAALVSTVAAYAVLRLLLVAFTVDVLRIHPVLDAVLVAAGVASVVAGSALAYRERDVKRLLAYSSVAQFGVVTLGIAAATPTALVGVVVHLVGHAVTKGGFYLAAGVAASTYGVRTVEDYAGFARRAPVLGVAVGAFALGLVGIPPTVGFAGKLYVLLGVLDGGSPVAAAVVLASTLTSLAYFAPLLQRVFVESPPADEDATAPAAVDGGTVDAEPSRATVVVVAVAALVVVALGFGAGALGDVVEPTVRRLLA